MKALTKNLMYFSIFFFFGLIVFRFAMSHFAENSYLSLIWITAAIFFFYNFFIGWHFGKRDYESFPLYDVGFRFHFVTYLLFHSVSISWFWLGFNSQFEKIGVVYNTAFIWGFFLLMHFVFYLYAQKQSIKGINKEDIFE